ncbi:hypothetical protein Pelo_7885 [Pelomyxa schiedti]|nr:hypothetical protein Pelo_7885 [Pelomyxa schiedti]
MSVLYVYYNVLSVDKPATSTETALLVRSASASASHIGLIPLCGYVLGALHQRVGGKMFKPMESPSSQEETCVTNEIGSVDLCAVPKSGDIKQG